MTGAQVEQAVGEMGEAQLEQTVGAMGDAQVVQAVGSDVDVDQLAEASAAIEHLIRGGFVAPLPHETGPVTIPDYVYQALDLEVHQAPEPQPASLAAAPVAMDVAPAPVAPQIVAVAPEFENRMSAMERSLAKMSQVIERFITRVDTAPIQPTVAPQLPSMSDDVDVSIVEQPPEPARRPTLRVRKNLGGKAPRQEQTARALRRARGIEPDDAEEEDDDDQARAAANKAARTSSPTSERSNGAGLSDHGIDVREADDWDEEEYRQSTRSVTRSKHDFSLNYFTSYIMSLIHLGARKMSVIKYDGPGSTEDFDYADHKVKIQTATTKSQTDLRSYFPLPRFDLRKFEDYADEHNVHLDELDVSKLYEDFCLRHRHLLRGDLSLKEKGQLIKQVPKLNETSDYQRALYLLTAHLCANDRNKAAAILFCFARVTENNIRRKLRELGC